MVASADTQPNGGADRGLVAEEELLASGLFGEGGEAELRELSWRLWGAGGEGMLLALVVRAAGDGDSEAVRVLERTVRVMPYPVLLSQAFAGGASTLTDGRVLAALHRGLASVRAHTPQLRAYARQLLLHVTSLLVSFESTDEAGAETKRGAATAAACHELLQLLLAVLDAMWTRVLAAKHKKQSKSSIALQGAVSSAANRAGDECKALVETSEHILAHTGLRAIFVGACSSVGEARTNVEPDCAIHINSASGSA
jgi:hypothetical protein